MPRELSHSADGPALVVGPSRVAAAGTDDHSGSGSSQRSIDDVRLKGGWRIARREARRISSQRFIVIPLSVANGD